MNELSFLDSIFNDVLANTKSVMYSAGNTPRVDVMENETSYSLEMELPGRSENDVNIELDHDTLTIASRVEETKETDDKEKDDKKCKYILRERTVSDFKRRFTIPSDVNAEEIHATFKNGILKISMNKKENAAPKTIAIEAC